MRLWGVRDLSSNPDILLVNTPLSDYGEILGKPTVYWPPMGLAYLGQYVDGKGFEAHVWDAEIDKISPEGVADGVEKINPRWVGFNTFTSGIDTLERIVTEIRKRNPGVGIMLGGIHATVEMGDLLSRPAFEGCVVVRNDGEMKAVALMDDTPFSRIPGIGYIDSKSGRIVVNEENLEWFVDINKPQCQLSRRFVPYDPVYGIESPDGKNRSFIATSRGCPYHCTFCASSQLAREGVRVRFRDPRLVVEEIIAIYASGQRDIKFNDDLAFRDERRICELLEPLLEQGYGLASGLELRGNGRANIIARLDDEVLDLMRDVGVRTIGMGAEQGTLKGMRRIKKAQTPQNVLDSCRRLAERGIKSSFNFMFGLPGQDEVETRAVVALALETVLIGRRYGVETQLDGFPLRPYPGTAIYNDLLAKGFSKEEILASTHIEIPKGAPGYKQVVPNRTFADVDPEVEMYHRQVFDTLTSLSTRELLSLQRRDYPLSLCVGI